MPDFPGLLYKGSVKDVHGVEGKDPYYFRFSDRYSIFDWGEMPDNIPQKGEALATVGDLFFRFLEKSKSWSEWEIPHDLPASFRKRMEMSAAWASLRSHGLRHHSLGLVTDQMEDLPVGKSSRILSVKSVKRILPSSKKENGKIVWDYSAYAKRPENVLVPLEVVFRFGAPEGSSFLKRANIAAGTLLPFPIVEFFTKLEPTDRFLSRKEALAVAGMSETELLRLEDFSLLLALHLREIFSRAGLELWDGKFEYSFLSGNEERDFQLVDSIGPDELRLIAPGGIHVSKEILRRVYRGTAWYQAVEEAKKVAEARGEKNWKKICAEEFKQMPAPLSTGHLAAVSAMYPALANSVAEQTMGKKIFAAPSLSSVLQQLKEIA